MASIQRTVSTRDHDMYVTKRGGQREVVSFDKIQRRIRTLGRMLLSSIEDKDHPAIQISQSQRVNATELDVNYTDLTMKVIDQMYDGISTEELDILTAEQCASLTTTHPDYGVLASRVVISNHHKNTTTDYLDIVNRLYHHKDIHGVHTPIINQELYDCVCKHHEIIQSWFVFDRDYLVDFFGFKTLERAYLMRIHGKIVERPQHMWMRVALSIHGNDLVKAKETYDLMSSKYFTHATPTLFNAGTPRPQMSSCYLIAMESDSLEGIYNTLGDCARISKWAGGIGLHIHNVRAKGSFIRGTNGSSNGIVPMLRVFNNTARYVDQCFTAETRVLTDQGRIPISEVVPHETCVITGSGSGYVVKELVVHEARPRKLMDVFVEGVPQPLKVTPEHIMLVFRNREDMHPSLYPQREMLEAYKSLLRCDTNLPELMYVETSRGVLGWVPPVEFSPTDWTVSHKDGELHYRRIMDTKTFEYSREVYDLVVDTEHHYQVDSGVVHNGGGKRAGSFAIYLEPWHADVEDFLEMRKNHGDEESKARDLFYALWIPDLFMRRVERNEGWTLMCPDKCPGLSDVVGDAFVELYERYEREGRGKQIPARKLWLKILDAQIETGTPYLLYKDASNQKSNQQNLGVIKSSNLCVAPETKILTRQGEIAIHELAGNHVDVWNGEAYSNVQVLQTGQNQELVRVFTMDNRCMDCTPYHKFHIETNTGVEIVDATDLRQWMRIVSWTHPTQNGRMAQIIDRVEHTGRRADTYCFNEPQFHRGVFNGILAGNCTEIIEYSDDKETAVCNLGSIALPRFVQPPQFPSRSIFMVGKKNCMFCTMAKNYMLRMKIPFVYKSIEDAEEEDRTAYKDFATRILGESLKTVPQMWLVASVASDTPDTSNAPTSLVDHVATCTKEDFIGGYTELMEAYPPRYDFEQLEKITRVLTRNLNRVIDLNFYPTDKTRRSNMRHRPIGIGVQGLADTFALMNMAFDGKSARALNTQIFETIYYASLKESCQMAKEEGPYETFDGSPAQQGKLQYDMWGRQPLPDRYAWDALKRDIRMHGLRNSLLVAPMPTASTSQILGYNECFEPFTNNMYMRRTLAGEFMVINKYLLRDLIDVGMWTKDRKNKIIMSEGSIQQMQDIPRVIRDKYKIVWEMSMKTLIDMASDRGAYVCQSQSMNLWMQNPNYKSLTSMHFYAWNQGLKTGIYYLRTKAKAKAQQFTVEPVKKGAQAQTDEPECEMCSG